MRWSLAENEVSGSPHFLTGRCRMSYLCLCPRSVAGYCTCARVLAAWPALLEVMASSAAAPFVLGVPTEMYAFGTEFSLFWIGFLVGVPLITHTLFTRLHRMNMVTVYEVFRT